MAPRVLLTDANLGNPTRGARSHLELYRSNQLCVMCSESRHETISTDRPSGFLPLEGFLYHFSFENSYKLPFKPFLALLLNYRVTSFFTCYISVKSFI